MRDFFIFRRLGVELSVGVFGVWAINCDEYFLFLPAIAILTHVISAKASHPHSCPQLITHNSQLITHT